MRNMDIQTDRQTETDRQRERQRQRDRERDRQGDSYIPQTVTNPFKTYLQIFSNLISCFQVP